MHGISKLLHIPLFNWLSKSLKSFWCEIQSSSWECFEPMPLNIYTSHYIEITFSLSFLLQMHFRALTYVNNVNRVWHCRHNVTLPDTDCNHKLSLNLNKKFSHLHYFYFSLLGCGIQLHFASAQDPCHQTNPFLLAFDNQTLIYLEIVKIISNHKY